MEDVEGHVRIIRSPGETMVLPSAGVCTERQPATHLRDNQSGHLR